MTTLFLAIQNHIYGSSFIRFTSKQIHIEEKYMLLTKNLNFSSKVFFLDCFFRPSSTSHSAPAQDPIAPAQVPISPAQDPISPAQVPISPAQVPISAPQGVLLQRWGSVGRWKCWGRLGGFLALYWRLESFQIERVH